ncbi:WG repeat-containing protein [Achromobacter xylosoxidans]
MAVPPRYDAAFSFVENGLALVMRDGQYQLIDRSGAAVGDAIDPSVESAWLHEGSPARLSVSYREEYRSPDGERRYARDGIRILSHYGKDLFIAIDNHGMYGLLDANWNWRVAPSFSDISQRKGDAVALAIGEEEVVLIDAGGALIGEGRGYQRMTRVGNAFWSAQLPRKGYALLDASGKTLTTLTSEEAQASTLHDDTLLYLSGETLKAFVPGRAEPVTLGAGLQPVQEEGGYLLLHDAAGQVAGLLTPKGVWLQGDSAPPWLAKASRLTLRQGKLWLSDKDGQLLNALDADGRTVLQPEALQAAQGSQLQDMPLDVPGGPLGLLGQGYCHCNDGGAGLLLADGGVATDQAWNEVVSLDGERDGYAADDDNAEKLSADQLRFAAHTNEGVLLLDGSGKPMNLPMQQYIGAFRQGYALVYAKGDAADRPRRQTLRVAGLFRGRSGRARPGALLEDRRRRRSLGPVRFPRRQGGVGPGVPVHRRLPRQPGGRLARPRQGGRDRPPGQMGRAAAPPRRQARQRQTVAGAAARPAGKRVSSPHLAGQSRRARPDALRAGIGGLARSQRHVPGL